MCKIRLYEVVAHDTNLIHCLYQWEVVEPAREQYTCRPVSPVADWPTFLQEMRQRLENHSLRVFVAMDAMTGNVLGKIMAFDYNPRNKSAEFGYYLPPENRGKGFGQSMVAKFLSCMFSDPVWSLNKLYATTASGNQPSVRLLQSLGFHFEGVMREHYWFSSGFQDQWHFSLLKREWRTSANPS
ncbi:GNAT family N-acetyltransferase [Sulfobacillus thermosulfidooxidans]|uniref:GNAT family N-acetyltransferase n=1 Tax=Sulfobacillus thermosulfidooxidans TaxID=28034 RepID=UPI0006B4F8C1|nr:GNAT family protein [Sulfobacillus thermosulfidooxidans]